MPPSGCARPVAEAGLPTQVACGSDALERVVTLAEVDAVMAAIVGAAGLPATLAAARAGKDVMLANKEALVMSGALFMAAMAEGGGRLLPIDSEHSAVFQSLPRGFRLRARGRACPRGRAPHRAHRLGGAVPHDAIERLAGVTPQQACAHPNWVMGRKISVDSATMMKQGPRGDRGALALRRAPRGHPGGDPSAELDPLDGRVPRRLGDRAAGSSRHAHADRLRAAWPERIEAGVAPLDFTTLGALEFERVDQARFPCMRLAAEAMRRGGTAPAALNAANEIAVESFLDGRTPHRHSGVIDSVLGEAAGRGRSPRSSRVLRADIEARAAARRMIARRLYSLTP
jgi:1-deoxy-D-xylulose-5-phosphate reductoisomerase